MPPLAIWLGELLARRSIVLFVLAMLSVLAFEEVADDVFRDIPSGDLEAQYLDEGVAGWLTSIRSPRLTQAMTDITALGSVSVLAVVGLAAAALLIHGHRRGLVQLGLIAGGSLLIPWLLKPLFGRARPDVTGQLVGVTDLSFPSGHAFGATAIYLFLLLYGLTLLSRPLHQIFWIAFVAILIGLVGISRIYLGVHHATDVFGGIAAGAAWAFSIAFVFELTRHRSRL